MVIDQILQNILDGKLKPNDILPPISDLASMMNVGVSSIREAVVALELMDILYKNRHGNICVSRDLHKYFNRILSYLFLLGEKKVDQLFEVREIFEPRLSYLAAQRANKSDIDNIFNCLIEAEQKSEDPIHFLDANKKFHFAIAKASKNSVLIEITNRITDLIILISSLENLPKFIPKSLFWHRKIYNAIKEKNPTEASKFMSSHIKGVYQNYFHNNSYSSIENKI